MTQQSGGAGIPLTSTVAGVLSGPILAPGFATNGTTPILGATSVLLGANTALSSSLADIITLPLSAGIWWVLAVLEVSNITQGAIQAILMDSLGVVLRQRGMQLTGTFCSTMTLGAVVTIVNATGVKVQAKNVTGTSSIHADDGVINGTTATSIDALRIA